jgi:hypothetical protein
MPTDLERELLEMAAAERRRTQSAESPAELPELTPELLLSASARREIRAAQHVVGVTIPAHVQTPEEIPIEFTATVELSGPNADWVQEELRRGHNLAVSMGTTVARAGEPNANGDTFSPEALASLFMTREARSQAELAGIRDLVATEADIEFEPAGIEPIHIDPHRTANYGWRNPPSGQGMVVSQRSRDGHWTPTRTTPQRAPAAPLQTRPEPRGTRPSDGVRRLTGTSERPVDRSTLPTAFDRLIGRGPLDD